MIRGGDRQAIQLAREENNSLYLPHRVNRICGQATHTGETRSLLEPGLPAKSDDAVYLKIRVD